MGWCTWSNMAWFGSVWLGVVSKDFKGYLFVNIFCRVFVVLAQCGSVWLGVGQCGSVWVSVDQCGSVWVSVAQCTV